MSRPKDMTGRLERLGAFEERLGVSLEALSAFVTVPNEYNEEWYVDVKGELHLAHGTSLDSDLTVNLSVYDAEGRVVGTNESYVTADEFFGFETIHLMTFTPVEPARLRLFPKPN